MKTFNITLEDLEVEIITQLGDTTMLESIDPESAILAGIVNQIRRQDNESYSSKFDILD